MGAAISRACRGKSRLDARCGGWRRGQGVVCKSRVHAHNRPVAVRLTSYRRAARWVPRVAISVALAVYILVDVDPGDLARALAGVRLEPLLVAVGLYLVGQCLSAYKWSLLGRSVGFALPLHEYVRFYFVGMFFNLFGLSTLGGDLVRALYLGGGKRPGLAINSVVFDRMSGLVTLMALGAFALPRVPALRLPVALVRVDRRRCRRARARVVALPAPGAAPARAQLDTPPGGGGPGALLARLGAARAHRGRLAPLPPDPGGRAVRDRTGRGRSGPVLLLPHLPPGDQRHDRPTVQRGRVRRARGRLHLLPDAHQRRRLAGGHLRPAVVRRDRGCRSDRWPGFLAAGARLPRLRPRHRAGRRDRRPEAAASARRRARRPAR
jgi:hypothetical protein